MPDIFRYTRLSLLISLFFVICQGCAQPSQAPPSVKALESRILPGAWSTETYVPILKGKKVGLVVNQTSLLNGRHLVDTLLSRGVNVTTIFAPEHGLRGTADAGEEIKNDKDVKTGIPVISIYGNKKGPNAEDFANVDILVFDLQDVGARFYTYISTLYYIMKSGAQHGVPLIVLDRPNPNGHYVDGPVLDTVNYRSFVGMFPIPVVHGMTMGELAKMINGEKWISTACDLTVIPCSNYTHSSMYELPVKPSPNLPNLRSILLYPGICFFEGTPASVGRGTNMQFQVVGHPDYPDKSFSFTPKSTSGAKYPPLENQVCYGVDLTSVNIDSLFNTRQLNLTVLLDFYSKMPRDSFFNASWFDKLAGGPSFRQMILAGKNEQQIRQAWKKDLDVFKVARKKYLLYPDFE